MSTKSGFTTGSCAAAAAKAAAIMLFENKEIDRISIATPSGVVFDTPVIEVMLTIDPVSAGCAVKKPSSDDPDVTAGMLIYAKAQFGGSTPESLSESGERVIITAGEGIGRVTKPGLDRPVGDFAINSTPREMITSEVAAVMDEYEYQGALNIEISAPEGVDIAKKTFNPRLGIEGGISIIGTSGLVEPMSTKALTDTIKVELKQKKALGADVAVVSPGNYGLAFMKEHYDYDLDRAVKCSNFVGETIDMAKELGFSKFLLVGHVGKLIKLSGGIMNTHSHEADSRMELMAAAAVRAGAEGSTLTDILDCVSTEEAYAVMQKARIEKKSFEYIMERIAYYLRARAGDMQAECIVYSNKYGLLGATEGAEKMLAQASGQNIKHIIGKGWLT